jgi:hypothetical protein
LSERQLTASKGDTQDYSMVVSTSAKAIVGALGRLPPPPNLPVKILETTPNGFLVFHPAGYRPPVTTQTIPGERSLSSNLDHTRVGKLNSQDAMHSRCGELAFSATSEGNRAGDYDSALNKLVSHEKTQ